VNRCIVINHTDSPQSYMIEIGLDNAHGKPVTTAPRYQIHYHPGSVTVTGSTYPAGPIPGNDGIPGGVHR
jgi:hypothetical protein